MKYHIDKLNRDVELDDELVKIYTQYRPLRDSMLVLRLLLHYKDDDGIAKLSDGELSLFCNRALAEDFKNAINVAEFVKNNKTILEKDWWTNPTEVEIG